MLGHRLLVDHSLPVQDSEAFALTAKPVTFSAPSANTNS